MADSVIAVFHALTVVLTASPVQSWRLLIDLHLVLLLYCKILAECLADMAGVKVGCVHLCQVASNIV